MSFSLIGVFTGASRAEDWPTFRADSERSGFTTGTLTDDLKQQWVYRHVAPPAPAWPRQDRMPFDRAFHTAISDSTVYFGSSVDGTVYALDAKTGEPKWTFVTDAPVRFTPTAWRDRVYFVSDDGHLYCVRANSGELLWKRRGGPRDEMVLGNERMISLWPARGGPAIRDGVVYFAAGIWQSTGIFLYALDAKTGETIWENNDSGDIFMPQPHGGANAESGVSAQGHLIATDEFLLVPTGRAVPAVFDRKSGKFLYFHLQKHGQAGGTSVMVSGDVFFNSGILFDTHTGQALGDIGSGLIVQLGEGFAHATTSGLTACRWIEKEKKDKEGTTRLVRALDPYCTFPEIRNVSAMIGVGDKSGKQKIVAGGSGLVRLIDVGQKKVSWTSEVDGNVYGLAVADGRLYVSTDTGAIYCFGDQDVASSPSSSSRPSAGGEADKRERPYGENRTAAAAAGEILSKTNVRDGYCLDYGCGDGALSYELARRTNLTIYAVDDDPEKVAAAREKLTAAGLYGTRVTVHQRSYNETPYPKYFANLIVSSRSFVQPSKVRMIRNQTRRMLRPYGGEFCVGQIGEMVSETRGPIAGAGEWTHQYADPANTVCSNDTIQGELRPLWFRDVDQAIVQRHGRGPSPLYFQGILYSAGIDSLVAVDAYNGSLVWKYEIPGMLDAYDGDHLMGVSGTNSNYCVAPEGVFIRHEGACLQIDRRTGAKLAEFHVPRKTKEVGRSNTTTFRRTAEVISQSPLWGYIACCNGVLYGSIANPEHQVTYRYRNRGGDVSKQLTESTTFFALDAKSGKLLWRYDAENSIRHNAIAIGENRVYLIDRPLAEFDREKGQTGKQPTGVLLAFDARTGDIQWKQTEDVFGTVLALSDELKSLLMAYQPTRFALASEVGGRMAVYDSETGKRRWVNTAKYASRPIINGDTVYVQGGAWDLLSGQQRPFDFSRSYGCGILAAGKHTMVFRSATLGYVDFNEEKTLHNFGGMRPGCWINAIPAGGLVLVPDGTAGCRCSYQNQTWLALQSQ